MASVDPLKEVQKVIWSLGDYRELTRDATHGEELAQAAGVAAGMEVLDVAAGTGKVALASAARGAKVVATDITPAMIEWGRSEAAAAGLDIEWQEADAEDLPFEEGRFDRVLSSFGSMFTPNPDTVTHEMFRVTKPGGIVGMANWTAESYMGRRIIANMHRTPAPDPEAPMRWGEAGYVRERFEGLADDIQFDRRSARIEFESLQEASDFWERFNGPQIALRNILPPDQYREMLQELNDLTAEFNRAGDGSVRIDSDYLLVLARKPA
jgi:ubiquinone/menaquinone biosynthesis C-methylase UbiE